MEPKYTLTVIKHEKNENYEAELADYKEKNRYGNFSARNWYEDSAPRPQKTSRSLEVVLTKEEYEKVKQSVLTEFI